MNFKLIKLYLYVTILFCAAFGCSTPPQPQEKNQTSANYALSSRTLEISDDIPGLSYPYRVCTRKFMGICTRHEIMTDDYDLTDAVIRKQLRDAGFVCTVEVRP